MKIMKIMLKNFLVLMLSAIILVPSVAHGLDLKGDVVRVGLFYGSSSKSEYLVSGNNLALYSGNTILWSGGTNMRVYKTQYTYISPQGEKSYEDALNYGRAVYYKNGSYYPASLEDYGEGFSQAPGNNIIYTSDRGETIIIESSQDTTLESQGGTVSINGTKYRDKINIFYDGNNLVAVNVIEADNYLRGVIAKEMPSSWPLEALKAQAVVARAYVATNMNKHATQGFNVCATTHCQVYGGYSAETTSTNKAVDETAARLMYYGGRPAEGYFHSASGGKTENSGNIWNDHLPYLVGVEDPYSLGSPFDTWTAKISPVQMKLLLSGNGINIGDVTGVKITKTTENGRALELTIYGTKGTHILQKDRIRIFFGAAAIKSTYFTLEAGQASTGNNIQPEIPKNDGSLGSIFISLKSLVDAQTTFDNSKDSSESIGTLVFNGKGYGHGVGMSQYGARGMALEGLDYRDILRHYFKGIEIY